MGVDPADHIAPLDDTGGAGERRLGGCPVAGLEQVRDVVGAFVPTAIRPSAASAVSVTDGSIS